MSTDAIDTPFLFIVRSPGEINGSLCAHDGKLKLIVPNYTEVFAQIPEVKDGNSAVYAIEVPPEEVKVYKDGDKTKLLLWVGDPNARTKPQDKLTVVVHSLSSLPGMIPVGDGSIASPQELAKAGFAGLPENVQLAAVVTNTSDGVLQSISGITPPLITAIRQWASHTVDQFTQSQIPPASAAAGG